MKFKEQIIPAHGFIRKLLELCVLTLLVQIPIAQISDLVWERETTKREAQKQIVKSYGGSQRILGPFLALDYLVPKHNPENNSTTSEYVRVFINPEHLKITANSKVTDTFKGIFSMPTYTASIRLEGHFTMNAIRDLEKETEQPFPTEFKYVRLKVGIDDIKTLRSKAKGTFGSNSSELEFTPSGSLGNKNSLAAEVKGLSPSDTSIIPFSIDLEVGGSSKISLIPTGLTNEAQISANWPNPSFSGTFPPTEKNIDNKSFSASWKIPYFDNYTPKLWGNETDASDFFKSEFGVDFLVPVDAHRMVTRAIKYEMMFIVLTVLVFFIFEIVCDIRIHAIQYFFISAALTLFYLLLLSLAEQISFFGAFVIATLTVLGLVTSYSRVVLRGNGSPWLVATILSFFYSFLYTLLQEQDLSLLVGSIGLTFILAGFMYFTRNVNWHEVFGPKNLKQPEKVLPSDSLAGNI